MKFILILACFFSVNVTASMYSQNTRQGIVVTGTITDDAGAGIPGVNIVVKGSITGVISNIDGKYTITVPNKDAVLVFSFVGYTTIEQTVGDQTTMNVSLSESTQDIEEVVVIGYGAVKKSDLTGSVGSVSSDDITLKGTTSVMAALQGSIPGVEIIQSGSRVGSGFKIKVRGQNSISEGEPLYVVDGVVTDDIDFLNPADIEKIDVLKDASSTAIYGSRGSSGVILVQTKTADFGTKSRFNVSYDGYWGFRQIARVPEFMDGREWGAFRAMCYLEWDPLTEKWGMSATNKELPFHKGYPDSARPEYGNTILSQRLYDEDYTDWLDLATKNGHQQNHYVNISGNAQNISYNLGFGYQNEAGNIVQEKFDRYNAKLSINHRPSKYFQTGATANISFSMFDGGSQSGYSLLMQMSPLLKPWDDNGNLWGLPGSYDALDGVSFTGAGNPLMEIDRGKQETRRFNFFGSIYAQVTPIEGLDIKTTFSPRFHRRRAGIYRGITAVRSVDYASSDNREFFEYTWDNQISYTKAFDKHRINATVINSVYHTRLERLYLAAQSFPYEPDWYNLFSGTILYGSDNSTSPYEETAMLSFAGRVNYEFMNKYLLTATLRYDGSSKLAEKWNAFPSFALAWRMSEEEFLQARWLSNLKARFSFGYSGNNNGIVPYGTQLQPNTAASVYYDYNGAAVSGFAPGSPVNPLITWEKTRESNFGMDFGFLKNRIYGSVDIYDKLSDGLLMKRKLAVESGVTDMNDNIGSVSNRGIEFALSTINIDNNDFRWSTSLSFAYNKNAIRTLYGRKTDVPGESRLIGHPVNILYDYKLTGIWTVAEYEAGETVYRNSDGDIVYTAKPGEVKTLDANGDGILSAADKVDLGSPDPDWTGSFTSNFQYKNWDFSFVLYTRQGVFLYDRFFTQWGGSTSRDGNRVKYDYYVPPDVIVPDWDNFSFDADGKAIVQWKNSGEGHENAQYPIYNNAAGSFYGNNRSYQEANFVKVKNIVLGYTFNKNLIQKIGMSYLRVYANVLNPFVFTDYVGWDPEYAATPMNDGNGPSPVIYQLGVNVKF